jgi:hypothetical protein
MDLFVDVPLWSAPDVTLNQPVRGVFCDARIELISPSTKFAVLVRPVGSVTTGLKLPSCLPWALSLAMSVIEIRRGSGFSMGSGRALDHCWQCSVKVRQNDRKDTLRRIQRQLALQSLNRRRDMRRDSLLGAPTTDA